MKNSWAVIVNEECSLCGGDIITCENKSKAVNIASFVSRVLYNSDAGERYVFVVNKVKADDSTEYLDYRVIYHYSIMVSDSMKWIFLYDGWFDRKRTICVKFK